MPWLQDQSSIGSNFDASSLPWVQDGNSSTTGTSYQYNAAYSQYNSSYPYATSESELPWMQEVSSQKSQQMTTSGEIFPWMQDDSQAEEYVFSIFFSLSILIFNSV